MVTDGTLLKVYAWYDNEIGYACRMVDLANIVIERGAPDVRRAAITLIVTASYWGFTLTDGALRMLVLLHFYSARLHAVHAGVPVPALRDRRHLRQSRRRLARHALRHPAHAGDRPERCRSPACCMLSALDPAWSAALSVAWVVAAQGIAGRRQGHHQDRLEIRDQGDIGRRQRASCSNGSPGSPARRTR